jgi:hypothetical protein
MRLGRNQLQRLMGLASPGCLLIVAGDKLSRSLVARGLTKPKFDDDPDAWHHITPKGLRVLADALEAGELEQFMSKFSREGGRASGLSDQETLNRVGDDR